MPTLLQSAVSSGTSAGAFSLAFGSDVGVGDFIAVGCATNTNSGVTVTVSDSLGNGYDHAGNYIVQGNLVVSLWFTVTTNAGPCTVTATPSSGSGQSALVIADYSGTAAPTSAVLDGVSAGNQAAGGAAANTNPISVSGTGGGDLVVGIFAQVVPSITFTAGTGAVEEDFDATSTKIGITLVDLTPQFSSVTLSGTYSSSSADWAAIGASFFPGTPPPPYHGWDIPHTPQHQAVIAM